MGGADAKKPKPEATETKAVKADANVAATADGAKAPAKAKGKANKEDGVKERQTFERQRGSQWTLERCRKYARRYTSEAEWVAGSPASYKAATYWNWVEQCCEHMPTNLRLVHSTSHVHASTTPTATGANKANFKVVKGHKTAGTNAPAMEKKSKTSTKSAGSKDKKKKAS